MWKNGRQIVYLGRWIVYIYLTSNVLSGSVCIILISLKLTLCNLFCKQVLLQPDTSAELQMTGYGGAGRTRSRGPSMQQQLCGARQGEVGVSCLTVPNCGLSCSLQSSLQLHMRRSTSVTGRPGRESGTTTFVEYDLGLSRRECSCYVRNSATVQLPRAGTPALHCCLAQLHLLLLHGVLNWSFCNVKMSTAWGRNPSGDIGQSLSGGHHGDQTLLFSDAAGQLLDHMAQSFDDGLTRKR